jgi:thiosulfate/3-mercaptopyruvate sulfurtransferase
MDYVVTAEQLNDLMNEQSDPTNILLVDTRPFANYIKGHIPGAVNIDLMHFHWIDSSKNGIKQFNEQAHILLSNIGVEYNKTIVFYDEISGPSPARGVWLLSYFSHRQTSLLDGGYRAWQRNQNQIECVTNSFRPTKFRPKVNSNILADLDLVRSRIRSNSTTIIDTRSRYEYDGSVSRAARTGHIPSAINIDWTLNLDRYGFFKKLTQLRQTYSNVDLDAQVITYCQGGYRAANTFIALKMLDYKDVRMYLGSWGEWGNKLDLPVQGDS